MGETNSRRGQSVAQPMPVRDREKDREILAGAKEFDGDIDIDIDTESFQPREFDQEFKDCVAESRRVLRRESLRESLRAWLRVQVCLRESLQVSFRVWIRVCLQVCLHAERECCVRALGNQLIVDSRDCERMHVQVAHTSLALDKTNASADSAVFHASRAVAMNAAKWKQFELWQLEICDLRIKAWEEIYIFSWIYVLVQNVNACRNW